MANRAGNSSFWTTILSLATASTATAEQLFTLCIDKLTDRTAWLRDEITNLRAQLATATAGSHATVTGSVDLSGLTYDATAGTLNGLTFQIQADTGGVKTVTFGTGASAPLSPADVMAQIVTQTSGQPIASVDSAGHLSVYSLTTGSGSTINIVGGSAVLVLGFTNGQNATGVSSGNDGISRVSGAAVAGSALTLPAGTLRAMLQYIADHAGDAAATVAAHVMFLDVNAQTFTGTSLAFGTKFVAAAGIDLSNGLGNPAPLNMQRGSYINRQAQHISASATTASVGATYPLWLADEWHGSGGTLTVTLADYAGSDEPELELWFRPTSGTDVIAIQRSSGGPIVTITGAAMTRWRWDQNPNSGSPRWRYMGPGTLQNDPAKVSLSSLVF